MKRAIVIGALLIPSLASAHIHLTYPLSRTDLPTGDQKEQHCGTVGWNRAAMNRITTFQPGSTITVTWAETIQHPGWFRIAFQPNGEVFGIPPAGANGAFPIDPQLGVDNANQSIVLVDRIADGTLSQQITLPNMECNNCTLQFIQVMTDKPPYTTDAASDDIYFNCADITLSMNAPDAGPQNTVDAGPTDQDAGTTGGGNTDVSGGCSTGGNATGGLVLGVLLFGLRRRRSTH